MLFGSFAAVGDCSTVVAGQLLDGAVNDKFGRIQEILSTAVELVGGGDDAPDAITIVLV